MKKATILLITLGVGIWIINKESKIYILDQNDALLFIGIMITLFSGAALISHTTHMLLAKHDYEVFKCTRDAFMDTLNSARSYHSIENAAILKEIAEWNQKLAVMRYENKHWFLKDYIDDRVQDLKAIA